MERYAAVSALLGVGLFSLCAAVKDWDWYMNHRKARFMIGLIGRTGARIFYGTLGGLLCLGGVLVFVFGLPPRS